MKRWFPYKGRTRYGASSGVNESWVVRCEAIGKGNETHNYIIANEWIAANLGQFLRLPVPPFALLRKKAHSTWMFASFSFEGDTSPGDVQARECYREHPELCAGILVFDILIANCDRHRGNVKVDHPQKPTSVHIIDHDRALFYVLPGEGVQRLRAIEDRLGVTGGSVTGNNRHIFLDVVDDAKHLEKWTQRIRDVPQWFIEEICEDVVGAGVKRREIEAVKQFLIDRRTKIGSLLADNKSEFSGITTWPLLL
jgi:hypothetical protein